MQHVNLCENKNGSCDTSITGTRSQSLLSHCPYNTYVTHKCYSTLRNLLTMNPVIAAQFGYDVDAMNDSEKVTVVRRRVVYEELVMSKDEFDKMNHEVNNYNEETGEYGVYLSELEMSDIQFPDFTDEQTAYIAFPGDVTSFTDDAIAFIFENQPWTDGYEPVELAS